MKRKFLILSAMLVVVVSAVCLQSCNSDSYIAEEYGYYTQEEIDAIKAMAEKYELSIEIDESYYGIKQTLEEVENEMLNCAALLGEYKMTPSEDGKSFTSKKVIPEIARLTTRLPEGVAPKGSWSKTGGISSYELRISIDWEFDEKPEVPTVPGRAWGGASVFEDITCIGGGSFNCQLSYAGVYFGGEISFTTSKKITYKYLLKHGVYTMATNHGTYTIDQIR